MIDLWRPGHTYFNATTEYRFLSTFTIPLGPPRKLKLIEQGVTIFTKLNDLDVEKIPA